MRRITPYIPPLVWMAAIFALSTSSFGSEETGAFLRPVVRLFFPSISEESFGAVHALVRKAAHFTEYAVLAFLWMRAIGGPGRSRKKAVWMSFLVSAAYAATDEFHQAFAANRTPSALDALLDASGSAAALAAMSLKAKKQPLKGP